ncbi:ETC complex I subunit conserved region-domain-containing protein [Paraphysoderma sedebokerense]|nr:ETC complex I subunit conserved region-domain-containing protein [Paraphysoderma sedebokerense]
MRASLRLLQAAVKKTTGLTGIAPHPSPRTALISIYKETLENLSKLPSSSIYRQATAALTQQRLNIVEKTESVDQIENAVDQGPIEMLVKQAEKERDLVQAVKEWKSWEPLEADVPKGQWDYVMKEH